MQQKPCHVIFSTINDITNIGCNIRRCDIAPLLPPTAPAIYKGFILATINCVAFIFVQIYTFNILLNPHVNRI